MGYINDVLANVQKEVNLSVQIGVSNSLADVNLTIAEADKKLKSTTPELQQVYDASPNTYAKRIEAASGIVSGATSNFLSINVSIGDLAKVLGSESTDNVKKFKAKLGDARYLKLQGIINSSDIEALANNQDSPLMTDFQLLVDTNDVAEIKRLVDFFQATTVTGRGNSVLGNLGSLGGLFNAGTFLNVFGTSLSSLNRVQSSVDRAGAITNTSGQVTSQLSSFSDIIGGLTGKLQTNNINLDVTFGSLMGIVVDIEGNLGANNLSIHLGAGTMDSLRDIPLMLESQGLVYRGRTHHGIMVPASAMCATQQSSPSGNDSYQRPAELNYPDVQGNGGGFVNSAESLYNSVNLEIIHDYFDESLPYGRDATAGSFTWQNVVVHHTASSNSSSLLSNVNYGQRYHADRGGQFGYHFYIARDGQIAQGAPMYKRTNHVHGDPSKNKTINSPDWPIPVRNANSISVSLCGDGYSYTNEQIKVAVVLIRELCSKLGIDSARCFGHGEVQNNKMAEEGLIVARMVRGEVPSV